MTDLAISKKDKAHTARGMGFIELLAGYDKATSEHLNNTTFRNLAYMLGDNKLIYIHDCIAVDGTYKDTANSIGALMHDPEGEPSNLAIFPLDGRKPFTLHSFNNDALVIGEGGEWVAVDSLEYLTELMGSLATQAEAFTFILPLDPWQFDSLVKAHAKHRQVTIFTDYLKREALAKAYKKHNVRLVATVDHLPDLLMNESMANILASPDTKAEILGGIEWGKPEPLDDEQAPATRYPIEAWAGVLRDAVEAIAYHAQVPQAMAGQCVLGALATILQQYINAAFSDGEPMPVSLFLLTRGASTDGKNRTVRFSHKVIKDHQRKLDDKYRDDLDVWQADKRATPRKELDNFLITNPQPVQKTLFVSSGTLQGIISEMLNNQQKSIAWVTSDAGQFFGGYSMDDKNGNKTIADLSDVWSEGYFDNVTKGNTGNKRAYDLRFTLDLQGQDEIIRNPLADPIMNGQGFLPRFLFAFPDSMRGKRFYNTTERMNDNSEQDPRLVAYWQACSILHRWHGRLWSYHAYWQACSILLDPVPSSIKYDSDNNPIKINIGFADHQARQALADYQQYCENAIAIGGRLEKYPAYAGRQAENASRIAALMAYFDGRTLLTVDDIKRASLLTEYSITERMRYDGQGIGGDSAESDSQKLMNWLIKKAKEKNTTSFNRTYIANNCPNPMRKSSRILQQELDHLESAGYIRQETDGRKKVVLINPYLLA